MAKLKFKVDVSDVTLRLDKAIRDITIQRGDIRVAVGDSGRIALSENITVQGYSDDGGSNNFTGNTHKWTRQKAAAGGSTEKMKFRGKLENAVSRIKPKVTHSAGVSTYTFEWSAKRSDFDYAEHFQTGTDRAAGPLSPKDPPPWEEGRRALKFTDAHLKAIEGDLEDAVEKAIEAAFA